MRGLTTDRNFRMECFHSPTSSSSRRFWMLVPPLPAADDLRVLVVGDGDFDPRVLDVEAGDISSSSP